MTGCFVILNKPLVYLTCTILFYVVQSTDVEAQTLYRGYGFVYDTDEQTGRIVDVSASLDLRKTIADQNVTEEVISHFRKSVQPGDVMMFYVDPKIGGPANETFNVVAVNPTVAEFWMKIVNQLYRSINANSLKMGRLKVSSLYDDKNSTRPSGFIFSTHVRREYNELKDDVYPLFVRGYIPNPPKAEINNVHKPIFYRAERWTTRELGGYVGLSSITYVVRMKGLEIKDFHRTENTHFFVSMKNGVIPSNCSDTDMSQLHFEKSGWKDDDVPGLLLSKTLGGCTSDLWNVVPMKPSVLKDYMSQVESPVVEFLKNAKSRMKGGEIYVHLFMTLVYPDEFTTRPAGFFFHALEGPLYFRRFEPTVVVKNLYIPN